MSSIFCKSLAGAIFEWFLGKSWTVSAYSERPLVFCGWGEWFLGFSCSFGFSSRANFLWRMGSRFGCRTGSSFFGCTRSPNHPKFFVPAAKLDRPIRQTSCMSGLIKRFRDKGLLSVPYHTCGSQAIPGGVGRAHASGLWSSLNASPSMPPMVSAHFPLRPSAAFPSRIFRAHSSKSARFLSRQQRRAHRVEFGTDTPERAPGFVAG